MSASARAVDALVGKAGLSVSDAESAVRNLLLSESSFYGQYCELGAYEWFDRHHVVFDTQIKLTGQDVLNPNGCSIDGRLSAIDAYFDVKGLGFQAHVTEVFRQRLEQHLPGLAVTIDGAMDVAVKDIEVHAFTQLHALAKKLAGGGKESIPQLSWTIRVEPPRDISTTMHTIDAYRLAEQNRYYPFKTAGQFTRKKPFILIFAYAAQFNPLLFLNFSGSTDITLRSMARRAFFQLATDSTPAEQLDDQVAPGVSIADAARLISGLLFINLDNDVAWLFLNPRATHRVTRNHIEQMFDFTAPSHLGVDDFAYDNY